MTDVETVLSAIERASTAGEALDAVPQDWPLFLEGGPGDGHSCSLVPPSGPGTASRIYERGLRMGEGPDRLSAMKAAVAWLRRRNYGLGAAA